MYNMMPEHPTLADNVRAPFFYVLKTSARCEECGADVCVLAVALPEGHEVIDESDTEWSSVDAAAVVSFVAQLPDAVSHRLQVCCAGYRRVHAEPATDAYWANHCSQCAALFDEEALHSEPDVAFLPFTESRAVHIEMRRIDLPFNACVRGVSLAPPLFDAMRRV